MATETVIIAAPLVCIVFVLATVRLARRFAEPQPRLPSAEFLDQLSLETAGLLRLLSENEGQFLRAHLPRVRDDFKRLCTVVKVLMVESERDRPDLARALIHSQITFAYRMTMVRFRLGLGSRIPWT